MLSGYVRTRVGCPIKVLRLKVIGSRGLGRGCWRKREKERQEGWGVSGRGIKRHRKEWVLVEEGERWAGRAWLFVEEEEGKKDEKEDEQTFRS